MPQEVKYAPGEYNRSQLLILHYLRECGGYVTEELGKPSPLNRIAQATNLSHPNVSANIITLEKQSIVIRISRTEYRGVERFRPLIRVEMVDPNMFLPPKPGPLPEPVVVAIENEILLEQTAHEPTTDDIMEALVARLEELLKQVDKLQALVESLNEENATLKRQVNNQVQRKERPAHLTQKLQGVLTPDQWEALRHK